MTNAIPNKVPDVRLIMFLRIATSVPEVITKILIVRLLNQYAQSGPPFCQYTRTARPTSKLLIIRMTINGCKQFLNILTPGR